MRVLNQRAFVLHSRKYTDSKVLLDVLSKNDGMFSAVYRRGKKNINIQSFCELDLSWRGQGELKTLDHLDRTGVSFQLHGIALYCGLYINELTVRLLQKNDPNPDLFDMYFQCLENLTCDETREVALRIFEIKLLEILGFGIDFSRDNSGRKINSEDGVYYCYVPEEGFIPCDTKSKPNNKNLLFSARVISQLAQKNLGDAEVCRQAKFLCRFLLHSLLGDKPLKSRDLFC